MQDVSKIEIPKEPKLLFVVRIKNDLKLVPRARKILQAMRIFEVNNGVFLRLTENTAELLRIIEPFVAFGYPSLNSVRTLVYKRAYVRGSEGNKVSLTDNTLIEDALGEEGIICMEDLIHEIYTLGPNFKRQPTFCTRSSFPVPPAAGESDPSLRDSLKAMVLVSVHTTLIHLLRHRIKDCNNK